MGIGAHNLASNTLELILSGATYISIPGFFDPQILAKVGTIPNTKC
jgi:hypothetical protein